MKYRKPQGEKRCNLRQPQPLMDAKEGCILFFEDIFKFNFWLIFVLGVVRNISDVSALQHEISEAARRKAM